MANEIIDFERKGNVVRFYLGKNGEQWGDDWDDSPYDCNAGSVYDRYVEDTHDVYVPFDWQVLEPCDGVWNCQYSKKDMIERDVPCLIFIPPSALENQWDTENFSKFVGGSDVLRVYFGDTVDEFVRLLEV